MAAATLPNLIIIGAPKTGTTSLHYYLSLHPEILMSQQKELNFFIEEKNWRKGIEWYQAQFRTRRPVKIRGEASPEYTTFSRRRGVPGRMHSVVPDARLIFVVRDPLKRLISDYLHSMDDREDTDPDINRELRCVEENVLVMASRQCFQLEQYLPYYPMSRILVITHEDLLRKRSEMLRVIFRFLGVDESFDSPKFSRMLNTSSTKRATNRMGHALLKAAQWIAIGRRIPPVIGLPIRSLVLRPFSDSIRRPTLEPQLEQRLLEIFRMDVDRLRRLTGMTFEGWCV